MKRTFSMALVVALIISLSSCKEVVLLKSSPGKSASAPGQVKKTTGSKSAAPYAPGQKKKNK